MDINAPITNIPVDRGNPADSLAKVNSLIQAKAPAPVAPPAQTPQPQQTQGDISPDGFKARILAKYPDAVASDGRKYSDIPALELTQQAVKNHADGVTNDGHKYSDFLTPQTPTVPQAPNAGANSLIGRASTAYQGGIVDAAKSGIEQAKAGYAQVHTATNPIQALEGGAGLAAGVINTALSPVAPIMKPFGAAATYIGGKYADINPAMQRLANSPMGNTVERVTNDVSNLNTIAGAVAPIAAPAKAAAFVSDVGDKFKAGADAVTPDIKGNLKDRYQSQVKGSYQKIADTYVKPATTLDKSAAKGKDPVTFLSDRGIDPNAHVTNGKYDTADIANRIATKDTAPVEKVLDESLKTAQQGQPPVPVTVWKARAISLAQNATDLTSGDRATLIRGINRDFAARQGKNTIDLTSLNGEKRTYWSNTGFDTTGNLKGEVNYYIGKGAKETIEHYAKDANVTELNNYLGDHYDAAKFLNSFDGRKAVQTLGDRVKTGVIKGVSTGLGNSLGGIGGGVAGYIAGGMLDKALESASNPLKAHILNTLERTNHPAYEQAIKYLGQKEVERLRRPLLGAGNPANKARYQDKARGAFPIPLHGKTTFEAGSLNHHDSTAPSVPHLQLPPGNPKQSTLNQGRPLIMRAPTSFEPRAQMVIRSNSVKKPS